MCLCVPHIVGVELGVVVEGIIYFDAVGRRGVVGSRVGPRGRREGRILWGDVIVKVVQAVQAHIVG